MDGGTSAYSRVATSENETARTSTAQTDRMAATMTPTNQRIRTKIGIFAALVILCACGAASARFRQPSSEYAARRAKLRAGVDGPIVIYGYTGHEDASEVAIFFQEPNFYYLTGHSEPAAVLVIASGVSDA